VKVILRFKPENNDESRANQMIEYILSLIIDNAKEKALSALEIWYKMDYKDIEMWKKKCGMEHCIVSDDAIQMRKDYHKWFLSVDLPGSPAMILNNKPVPSYYTFNDVKYFLKRI